MNENKPYWAEELVARYGSGQSHAFLLHGNVADYVAGTMDVESYLTQMLSNRLVVVYDVARGITFPMKEQRQLFMERMGLAQPAQPVAQAPNAAVAALAAARGGGQTGTSELPRAAGQAIDLLEKFLTLPVPRIERDKLTPEGQHIPKRDPEGAILPGEFEREKVLDPEWKLPGVILMHLDAITPNATFDRMAPAEREVVIRLQQMGRNIQTFEQSRGILVGVVATLTDIHESLRMAASRWEGLEIDIPNQDERLGMWEMLAKNEDFALEEGLELPHLARVTAGLGRIHLEDIALRASALSTEESISPVTVGLVRQRKRDIISAEFDDVIELVEPAIGWAGIGGEDALIEWAERNIIHPLKNGNARRCPKGVLGLGPAGTGKSTFFKALAYEARVNFVAFNPARILGGIVGTSERNLEKALRMIYSLSPTLVFIDELDQAFQRGAGGDSGVSQRLFRRILEVIADPDSRGRVVWLGASNRPDLIDAALKRPGRFDKAIPFLAPDAAKRARIADVMFVRHGARFTGNGADLFSITAPLEGWTGAEIESLVLKAIEIAEDESSDWREATVSQEQLQRATRLLRSSTQDVEFMTMLALREVNDLDLLPPGMRERARDTTRLDADIQAFEERNPRRGRREL